MILWKREGNLLKRVKENPFKLEKNLQNLIERNLKEIFYLTLIESEFSIKWHRFDTLAYDEQNNSFVIIEYKRNKNSSVVDQGFSYLNLMLNNKAEFVLKINEKLKMNMKKSDVDWSQSKILFIASSFTNYQKSAVDFEGSGIELCEVKQFENDCIYMNLIKPSKSNQGIKILTEKVPEYSQVSKEIKTYTEEWFLNKMSDDVKALYQDFRDAILNLNDSIEVNPQKLYVGFKLDNAIICDIEPHKKHLKIYLNAKWGALNDAKGLFQNISKIGHWGNGDYRVQVSDTRDLEYILSVLKQVTELDN